MQASTTRAALSARQTAAERRRFQVYEQMQAQEDTVQQLVVAIQKVTDRMNVEQKITETLQNVYAEAQVRRSTSRCEIVYYQKILV